MSRNARARAEEFSWDRIAAEYEAVLLRRMTSAAIVIAIAILIVIAVASPTTAITITSRITITMKGNAVRHLIFLFADHFEPRSAESVAAWKRRLSGSREGVHRFRRAQSAAHLVLRRRGPGRARLARSALPDGTRRDRSAPAPQPRHRRRAARETGAAQGGLCAVRRADHRRAGAGLHVRVRARQVVARQLARRRALRREQRTRRAARGELLRGLHVPRLGPDAAEEIQQHLLRGGRSGAAEVVRHGRGRARRRQAVGRPDDLPGSGPAERRAAAGGLACRRCRGSPTGSA